MGGQSEIEVQRDVLAEAIARDIRDALAEMRSAELDKINFEKAIIVIRVSDFPFEGLTEILGMKIFVCDLATYHNYYIAFNDPNKEEDRFIWRHRQIIEAHSAEWPEK